jgi:glyceraldehyde-3-phosphate dehydrogenase/erythrose-4-phosphate dehydrogenase
VHGKYPGTVTVDNGKLVIDGKPIVVSNEKEPEKIRWGDAGAVYVVESTGIEPSCYFVGVGAQYLISLVAIRVACR